jgi:2'-5' RNA ligase
LGVIVGYYFKEFDNQVENAVDDLPAFDIHLTIAYCGEDDDYVYKRACGAVATVTRNHRDALRGPLRGATTGIARFKGEDGSIDPVVALIDIPELYNIRLKITKALKNREIEYDERFIPHVTLGYVKKKNKLLIPKPIAKKIEIPEIYVATTQERKVYSLVSDKES